ncbi:MAG TPA: hypothetical protein ENK23_03595 [Sorangium sp.]|nr:hypothetical protein [Sorangium sp.]
MTIAHHLIGVDENGLGPRLGPMLVTAVLARASDEGRLVAARKPRGGLRQRLGDSKALMAHGDIGLGEAWARVLVARGAGKHKRCDTPDDVVHSIALQDHAELTAPCPQHVAPQCWSSAGELFLPDEDGRGTKLRKQLHRDLDRLARRGLEVVQVRSAVVCTRRLNDALLEGHSRFAVDLHCMERLILDMRASCGAEVDAVCGKVGGYGVYGKAFGPLAGRLHLVLEEGRARSAYRFPGIGNIAFVRDSDGSHLLVGLASLVGKYLRELLMGRIVRHYQRLDGSVPMASGYHDPVTRKFVLATEALRRQKRIPAACFERNSRGGNKSLH